MRKASTRIASIIAGTGLVAGLGLAASVTPLVPAESASAAPAPSCIDVTTESSGWPSATITNGCSGTQRVKVVWAYGPDSECVVLGAGRGHTDETGVAGKFDGLEAC